MADVLDLLSRLVDKSLVMSDGDFAGERRYRLIETVRQYARERLVEAEAADRLRERHFEFSSTSSVEYCPFSATTVSWLVSSGCGSSWRTSATRLNGR